MKSANKLIIVATVAPAWIFAPEDRPAMERKWTQSPEELAEEACRCQEAGASVLHVHGERPWPLEKWTRAIGLIRRKCDIIVQAGLSGRPLGERKELVTTLRPEMVSVSMSHSDERYTLMKANVLHTVEEILEFLEVCKRLGVKPEFEIHTTGALWNFQHLPKRLVGAPPYLTFLFGWPGGRWTPATMDEVIRRFGMAPSGALCFSSVNPGGAVPGPQNPMHLAALAMMLGHNVRVGTEDYPYLEPGVFAKDSSELVARVARIAEGIGREVATPKEARRILNIKEPI